MKQQRIVVICACQNIEEDQIKIYLYEPLHPPVEEVIFCKKINE